MTVSVKSSLLLGESKGERTRAALVDAAIRRFAADGFQRTSVTQVARAVRVSPAAVYRYFPDKEALFAAAVDADAAALVELARAVLTDTYQRMVGDNSAAPVAEAVGELVASLPAAVDNHPLVARVLAGAEPMTPERIMNVTSLVSLRDELADLLRLGQEIGLVRREVDAQQLALGIETVLLTQLAYAASLRRAGEAVRPTDARWTAVGLILDAAIRKDPT